MMIDGMEKGMVDGWLEGGRRDRCRDRGMD
jgi:hypothetical protein